MDRTLSAATTPGQSWFGSIDYEGILHIPQIVIRLFSVISVHLLGRSYPSVEIQSVYSTALTDWADYFWFKH